MIDLKKIKPLINSLNQNAPLIPPIKGYKYPYKPALIIAIIECIKDPCEIFNHSIVIKPHSPIVAMYYNILTNSETIYNFLSNLKSKEKWFLNFNEEVKKSVVFNIFEMPANKISAPDIWEVNRKDKTITIHLDGTKEELEEYKNLLLSCAYDNLKKCVPDYQDLGINEIVNYQEYLKQELLSIDLNLEKDEVKRRKYQHIFRKEVNERDQKCMLCNLDVPQVLEAAHIKAYVDCCNNIERYDVQNGILLCRNHHKMFDANLFTFDKDWNVIVNYDVDESIKQTIKKSLDNDYTLNFKRFSSVNDYLLFHNQKLSWYK